MSPIPPGGIGGIGDSFFGFSAIIASFVIRSDATLENVPDLFLVHKYQLENKSAHLFCAPQNSLYENAVEFYDDKHSEWED